MIVSLQYILAVIAATILTGLIAAMSIPALENKFSPRSLHWWRYGLLVLLVALIVYLCYENFPLTLTLLVAGTAVITLIDALFFAKKRHEKNQSPSVLVENARGFFPVLLLVWIIRTFIVQPYHVPSGSLEPTIMTGDFIGVNQFSYGLRVPVNNTKIFAIGEPKVGDIVLFYYPIDPRIVFIKRVIGVPGDHIAYKNKVLYLNGKEATQQMIRATKDVEPAMEPIDVNLMQENLNGVQHEIFVHPSGGEDQDFDLTVPAGMYFMMGDNRDMSGDSRIWGFVPEHNIIGKAFGVWMNWDPINHKIQWDRIGRGIH